MLLASGGVDRTVRLWNPQTGAAVGVPLTGHSDRIRAVAAVPLPDGRVLLASASTDQTVRRWELVQEVPAPRSRGRCRIWRLPVTCWVVTVKRPPRRVR